MKTGFPWLPMLTLLFIGLKLGGAITWSWFWVLSPLLIPLGIVGVLLFVVGILYLIGYDSLEITQKTTKRVK